MWPAGAVRVLAGCAPCQPFSPYRRGADTTTEDQWSLLNEFGRLVRGTRPDVVTMENVPRIGTKPIFRTFVETLARCGYSVDFRSCYCPSYGVAQHRRRLVLLASRLGKIAVPKGPVPPDEFRTVRQEIAGLPRLRLTDSRCNPARQVAQGSVADGHPYSSQSRRPDPVAPGRIGTPASGRHAIRRTRGLPFGTSYARMAWDEPAPTITTLAFNFGAGRFGHPEQHRAISLREAAILRVFPAITTWSLPISRFSSRRSEGSSETPCRQGWPKPSVTPLSTTCMQRRPSARHTERQGPSIIEFIDC